MIAILCPGQGSQSPGLLTPWLEIPGVSEHLATLSEAAGLDLRTHGSESDEETIKDTAIAQPLIVAAGLAALPLLLDGSGTPPPGPVAGHSVGEITAATAAGVLTEGDAMSFVAARGAAMAEAGALARTGMSAVMGGEADDVLAALEGHGLVAANRNGAGQVVAAGTLEQLAALAADPPARTRVIPLKVAGAFHTEHMAPAVQTLADRAGALSVRDPSAALLSNRDGAVVGDGAEVLTRLIRQVSSPVRWDLTMETLAVLGVTAVVELPPAGALAGLARRGLKGVQVLALKSPDDLEAARTMLKEHA